MWILDWFERRKEKKYKRMLYHERYKGFIKYGIHGSDFNWALYPKKLWPPGWKPEDHVGEDLFPWPIREQDLEKGKG